MPYHIGTYTLRDRPQYKPWFPNARQENPNKRRDMDRWRLARLRRIVHGPRNPNRGRQLAKALGFRMDRSTGLLIETETGRFLPRSVLDQILETLQCSISTLRFLAS